MNLQASKLFFLMAALLLLVACGGVSESDIEATVEARVEQAKASLIVPTVAPLPTYTPYPVPTPEVIVKEVPVETVAVVTATPTATTIPLSDTIVESAAQNGKDSPFTNEQYNCMLDALGESTLLELPERKPIAWVPTAQEYTKMLHCFEGQRLSSEVAYTFDQVDSPNGQGDQALDSKQDNVADSELANFRPADYPRAYKNVIKGIWEPGAWDQLAIFVGDTSGEERLRSLGVNTVSVVASFTVQDNGGYNFTDTKWIEQEIVRYKKLGFAVFLSGHPTGFPRDADPQKALENYLQSCKMAAIELAMIGEQYNVEYLSPSNEFEGTLANEVFPIHLQSPIPPETFDPPDSGMDARVETASKWFTEMLPALKREFSGKLVAKIGKAHYGYKVEGYDYLAFTINHQFLDQKEFRRLIRKQYKEIAQAATTSGVSWMVGEAHFYYGGEGLDLDATSTAFLKDLQQHYFEISLDEYLVFGELPQPSGYIFIGYFMEGIKVKDTASETVISDNFARMD